MYPFEFDMPTKVHFGNGAIAQTGAIAAGFGKKALLLTYDEDIVKELGYTRKSSSAAKKPASSCSLALALKGIQPWPMPRASSTLSSQRIQM